MILSELCSPNCAHWNLELHIWCPPKCARAQMGHNQLCTFKIQSCIIDSHSIVHSTICKLKFRIMHMVHSQLCTCTNGTLPNFHVWNIGVHIQCPTFFAFPIIHVAIQTCTYGTLPTVHSQHCPSKFRGAHMVHFQLRTSQYVR